MRFFMVVMCMAVVSFAVGCKSKIVIRDAKVYKAELDFVEAATEEMVERGEALIAESCVCEEKIVGVPMFIESECHKLAETVLVLKARMKYHLSMMRHLGGLQEERPPKEPPSVSEPSTLCKE